MPEVHARLSASGSATWLNCPKAPELNDNIPDESSPFAEEGTNAHSQAEAMLLGEKQPYPDMAKDVSAYVDYVLEQRKKDSLLLVEKRVEFDEWVPEGFGTCDAVVIHTNGSIDIIDLKFGKGVKVDAEDNTQLRLYALGALQRWQFQHDITEVTMHIVQPRLDHVSTETISADELLKWGEWVKGRVAEINHQAKANPGTKQCQWCKARFTCRARAKHMLDIAGSDLLGNADYAVIWPHLAEIKRWLSDVESHVTKVMTNGDTIPGLKLVEGRSVRKLTDKADHILREAGLTDDQIYKKSFANLTSITKALGSNKGVLEQCTVKPPGKPTVVPVSDRRKPLNANVAQNFPIGE